MKPYLNSPGRLDDRSKELFGVVPKDRKGTPADMFGKPTLEGGGDGKAAWSRSLTPGTQRVAWSAKLDAGKQTGWNDYAKVIVPVNEMPFVDLKSVRLAPYYSVAVGIDMAVCVYMHDPGDFDNRIELSHTPFTNTAAGYRELDAPFEPPPTANWFWYGSVTGTPSNCPTEGTAYSWNQFQTDDIFRNWTIYRISLDYGYHTGDTVMNGCYLCQAQINGTTIRLEPSLLEQSEIFRDEIANAMTTIPTWKFGPPEIRCDNHGWGRWEDKALNAKDLYGSDYNRQFRYSNWAVHLNGGPQASGEDWASLWIPCNDIPLIDIDTISWAYYKFLSGTADLGGSAPAIVISTCDPANRDERADITITASAVHASPGPEAGWHEFRLTKTFAAALFWYGDNITSDITEGANATLATFQADKAFSRHVIFNMRLEYGYWGGTRSAGDVWIGMFQVNDEEIPLIPPDRNQLGTLLVFNKDSWVFGKPELMSNQNSKAEWFKSGTSPYYQKGPNGYLAKLYGGIQTGDDWAGVFIPVNELPVPCFDVARWSYYMDTAESFGCNMVIWVHDPFDFDIRAEITQRQQVAGLEKGAGWNAHELDPDTSQFFYYGEGIANTSLIASAGTDYTWKQYRGDERFNTLSIYRISFEFGWQSGSQVFGSAWLADVILNDQIILMGPPSGKHKNTVLVSKTLDANDAYHADDVISEDPGDTNGTDWDFEMGGTGYITKAVLAHVTNANTARVHVQLYSRPPTCELDDHAASTGPITADIPYFLGTLKFDPMTDEGTGHSYAVATPNTDSNLPIMFDTPIIYAVSVTKDAIDFADDTLLTIILSADMEDN